jgi:glutathione S-transferase
MTPRLKFYFHPLSSFCQKALMAFYENDTPFEPCIVNLGDPTESAALKKMWPLGKFPLLRDDARNHTIPESSIIIEYLAQHYPGPINLIGETVDSARQIRMRDRFYDLYLDVPMQKIVGDRLRPADQKDAFGVAQARDTLKTALDIAEGDLAGKAWAMGKMFTMADCAAAPALYYVNLVMPFGDTHKNVMAYFNRLLARPSFARAVKEAEPYRALFPK